MEGLGPQGDAWGSPLPADAARGLTRRSVLLRSAGLALALCGTGRAAAPASAQVPAPPGASPHRLLIPGTRTIAAGTSPGYNAYPGFCKLANGKRLVIARRATGHAVDGGRAWMYLLEPDDRVSSARSLSTLIAPSATHMDSGLLTCSDGRVVCVYAMNRSGYRTSRVARIYSDDHGATWSPPALIADGFAKRGWSCLSASPIQLPNGELRLGLYGSDGDEVWYVRLVKSTDRGKSWTDMGVELALPGGESAAEPNLARLADGRLLMAIRAGDIPATARQRILGCWSSNGGTTWTAPVEILADANARPSLLATPDGDVIITNRGATYGNPQGFLAVSADGGRTFPDSGRQQLAASKERFVYGAAIYDGTPRSDGAVQIVAAQEVVGGANLYLYRLARPTTPAAPGPSPYDDAILATAGLVAYWPLSESSGQQAGDLKGGHHGTLVGDVRRQPASALGLPASVLDTADDPVHKQAFIKVPHAPALNLAGAMTIECWAAPAPVNGTALVVKGGPYAFRFELLGGRMLFSVNGDDHVLSSATVTAGEPHMFAVTWDGAVVRFYLDGEPYGDVKPYTAAQIPSTSPLWIGTASNATAAATLAGPVAGVALYEVALDEATVAAHHAAAAA